MLAAPTVVNAEDSVPKQILCYGDSITGKGEWVTTVGVHKSFVTINAGKSGRKAANAKNELKPYLEKYQNLDKVIMLLGANDLPARDKRPGNMKVTICTRGMSEAVDLAMQHIKPQDIILVAPCNVNSDTMRDRNRTKGYHVTPPLLKKLEEEYKALAKKKGIRFASLLNVVSKENYKDGLHPNKAGDAEIAEAMLNLLTKPEGANLSVVKIENGIQAEESSADDDLKTAPEE